MKAIELTNCPRTRATECSCSSIKSLRESKETVIAQCDLQHSDTVKGTILFIQAPGTETLIKGTVSGLEPGDHGFHVHEFGDMSKGCESMGGHYNPDGAEHGNEDSGHVGDLGNINADNNGVATIKKISKRIDLFGDRSIVGRGLVVHKDPDDLGQGNDEESLKTGNAGDRLACGVITLRSTE
jgi:Cu-Zn family superoxide dismutase